MSEETGQVPPIKVRRGLPRVAGTDGQVAAVDSSAAIPEGAPQLPIAAAPAGAAPAASAGPARRRGLSRTSEGINTATANAEAATTATTATATATTAVAPATATVLAAATAGGTRRSGLARTAEAGTAPANNAARSASVTEPPAVAAAARQPLTQTASRLREANRTPAPAAVKFDQVAFLRSPRGLAVAAAGLLVIVAAVVLAARWLVTLDFMEDFLITYPGESHLPANAPVGLPAWLGWQHFLNAFFLVLIIRTGWQVRTQKRPPASWTRNNSGFIKTKNLPKKISLTLWAHLSLDALWVINGIVFIVVLFATGQWMRVTPTSWDVFPNALSAALQYLSLDWPMDNGWVNYNSLQLLAYFLTIFVAAPLAAITGFRMSGAWPMKATRLNRLYPMEAARAIHFPVMLYFVLFVIAHVTLVMATGALRNLNHMFAMQDTGSWIGFWIFFASVLVMAGSVFASRPLVWAPIAQLFGNIGR